MAGKRCPSCNGATLFTMGNTMKCKCGFQVVIPPNEGAGGRGLCCVNCGHYKVFNDKCNNCGARYSYPST